MGTFLMMIVVFKKGVMLTQRDAVSRADFTSRHLFQVIAQTRYNNSTQSHPLRSNPHSTGHCAAEGKSCAVARSMTALSRTNLIDMLIRRGTNKLQ
jgi:hypothetical protein